MKRGRGRGEAIREIVWSSCNLSHLDQYKIFQFFSEPESRSKAKFDPIVT